MRIYQNGENAEQRSENGRRQTRTADLRQPFIFVQVKRRPLLFEEVLESLAGVA